MGEHFDNSAQALKDDGRSTLESMSQDEVPTAPERRKPLQLFDMSFGLLIMDEAHEARNKGAAHSVCRYLAAKSAMSVLVPALSGQAISHACRAPCPLKAGSTQPCVKA